jgi:phytoene desaturase
VSTLEGKRACVIGAGFGGLALAIRLQSAGVATTLIEARDKPGGQAGFRQQEGFTFDAGPAAITDPASLRELWGMTGHVMAADVELLLVMPFCRFNWPDGTSFDYSNDLPALHREIARLDPADIAGFDALLDYAGKVQTEEVRHGSGPLLDFGLLLRGAPALAKQQAWRSVDGLLRKFIRSDKLREALGVRTLLTGGNPMSASAVNALNVKREQDGGMWWARGGTSRLVAGMVRQFERLGGEVRLGDAVGCIDTMGTRATEVETRSGWRSRFDAVASNADLVHTYRDLLGGTLRGAKMGRRLARKRFSHSLFVVHFGIEGSWPGIPHHMILFGPRYEGLLADVFAHGVLPADQVISLHHPTVTDPSLAPEGKSVFQAAVPVAHMGKLAVDWGQIGPLLERRVLAEVERRLIPDLSDRIVTRFHYTPRDYASDLNAHLGSTFSLEPILTQSGYFRGHNRDDVITNLYLVGAGAQPGAGVPGALAGARVTAGLMLEDLAR